MNGHPGVSNVFTWWNHHRRKSSGTSLPCLTEVTGTGCLIFCFQLLNVHLIQSISTYLSFFSVITAQGRMRRHMNREQRLQSWELLLYLFLWSQIIFTFVCSWKQKHSKVIVSPSNARGPCVVQCWEAASPMQSFAHSCLRVVLVSCNQALCGVCELAPVTLEITLCKEFVFLI